jgi:NAD(P)-dependent dehydrogenase (short-subunit alcohol dehydrogenase family)
MVGRKIRVNCVAPGPIWTLLTVSHEDLGKGVKAGEGDPLERSGQPEEVAPAYIFAFNVDSSYITGEVLTLLGEEQRTA